MNDLAFTVLAGDDTREDLLVVGASLGTSVTALWPRCAALLGDHYQVVGWDHPGHGRSRPADGPFSVEDLASVVRERAAVLARDRRTWYAGVSLGGAVGLALSLDPGPFLASAALASAPKIGEPDGWRERAELVRRTGTAVMVSGSAERWFAPGFLDRQPAVGGALLESLAETDRSSYAWACEALAEWDVRARLAAARIPVLLAPGEHDVVLAPGDVAESAAAAAAVRVEVVSGVGHLPPAEQPAEVADLLRRFLVRAPEEEPAR